MTKKHPVVIASAAAALSLLMATAPQQAHARHHHHHGGWRIRPSVGAVIAGAVIGAAVLDASVSARVVVPPVSVQVETAPPPPVYYPPPPPPVYYPPPPPPPVYAPPPAPVMYALPAPRPEYPQLGLAVSGTIQSGRTQEMPVGGVAAALQIRTSRHSMLGLELQSVGAYRPYDGTRRNDLDVLLSGRVFLWDAALAPYLELAGGMGRTSVHVSALESEASQLLGRIGVGLELRLGRHLFLDGQIAQLHRLNLSDDDRSNYHNVQLIDEHERATEFRGGIGFRF